MNTWPDGVMTPFNFTQPRNTVLPREMLDLPPNYPLDSEKTQLNYGERLESTEAVDELVCSAEWQADWR